MPGASHRFGHVEVRPLERQMLIDGKPARLGARAFDVLLALIERRQRVVTKNELLELVWPGLVVEENNLQVQVSTLRKMLGTQAIATIPGRGYRFTLSEDGVLADAQATGTVAETLPGREAPVPVPVEPLIARDADLDHLARLLHDHRLVTIIGAAGVGKTTLARAIVNNIEATVVGWAELAPITDPTLIPSAIARALQLPLAGTDAESALLASMRSLDAFVVLDNAEHLIHPLGRLVARLLSSAPALRLLVTSQAPLKVDGEWLLRLEPLSCPPADASPDRALSHGAVALFAAQANASGCRFALDEHNVGAVIEICRRLDGVPLAVKLAAARLPLLGLTGLHASLAQCLKILGSGPRDATGRRHETLRQAFDWSHGLLATREQAVFRRLGIFVDGFTLQSASTVCTDEQLDETEVIEGLSALVDRSFIVVDGGAQPRYRLLETAREYALLQLERSGEFSAIGRRHAYAMLSLLKQANDTHWHKQGDCFDEALASDLENVRAAVYWGIANDATLAVRLAGEARLLFQITGQLHDALTLTDRIEPLINEAIPPDAAASFWLLRSQALQADAREQSAAAALKAVELSRVGGDPRLRMRALYSSIVVTSLPLEAKERLLEELKGVVQPDWPTALPVCEGVVAWKRGDRLAARNAYAHAVALTGHAVPRAEFLKYLAGAEQALGLLDDAVNHARESVELSRGRGPSNRLHGLSTLAGVLVERGELSAARAVLVDAVALTRRSGWWRIGDITRRLVSLAACEGRMPDAAQMLGYLRKLDTELEPLYPEESHMRRLSEETVSAALAPDELARYLAQGGALDEAAVCTLGLAVKSAVAED